MPDELMPVPRPKAPAGGPRRAAQVVALASGKGGVGKTSLVANLAIALAAEGARVLAIDGDLGLANLHLAFGVTPGRSIVDVLTGTVPIARALTQVPGNVTLLSGSSGDFDVANLSLRQQYSLFTTIDTLEDHFDVLVIDTAAGIGGPAVSFAASAEQVVVVATSEPTSMADAYAFIKVLCRRSGAKRVHLVANRVRSAGEGERLYCQLAGLLERFLAVSLDYAGAIVEDEWLGRSMRAGRPMMLDCPERPAARSIALLARRLRAWPTGDAGGIRLFWRRLLGRGEAA